MKKAHTKLKTQADYCGDRSVFSEVRNPPMHQRTFAEILMLREACAFLTDRACDQDGERERRGSYVRDDSSLTRRYDVGTLWAVFDDDMPTASPG
jgi:hypothetical protein